MWWSVGGCEGGALDSTTTTNRYRTFFRTQTRVYAVMEYAPNGDLLGTIKRHRLAQRPIAEAQICIWLVQILEVRAVRVASLHVN